MTKFDKSKLPSRYTSTGPSSAPHRSYYYAMGMTKKQINQPFVGVVSTFLGGLCRILLVKRAGAVFTSINGYLVPLVTCSLGIIFLNETLDVNTILSFLIVITGVLISQDLHNKFLKL